LSGQVGFRLEIPEKRVSREKTIWMRIEKLLMYFSKISLSDVQIKEVTPKYKKNFLLYSLIPTKIAAFFSILLCDFFYFFSLIVHFQLIDDAFIRFFRSMLLLCLCIILLNGLILRNKIDHVLLIHRWRKFVQKEIKSWKRNKNIWNSFLLYDFFCEENWEALCNFNKREDTRIVGIILKFIGKFLKNFFNFWSN
jgi:hypothetical protein